MAKYGLPCATSAFFCRNLTALWMEQTLAQNRARQTPFKVHRGHPISGTNLARRAERTRTMEKRFAAQQGSNVPIWDLRLTHFWNAE